MHFTQFMNENGKVSGVVTTSDYVTDENGDQFNSFYCSNWEVITDKENPLATDFRSGERWQLVAYRPYPEPKIGEPIPGPHPKVAAFFPGCRIMGFVQTDAAPAGVRVKNFDKR